MDSLQRRFERAVSLHQNGHLAEAELLYQQILAENPKHFHSWHFSGVIAAQTGFPELAVAQIDRAIDINPHNPEAFYNKGLALQTLKNYDAAKRSFEQALQLKPCYAEAHFFLGNNFLALQNPSSALPHFVQAISLKPDYAEAYNQQGATLQILKRYQEALGCFAKATALKPDYAEAFNNLGNLQQILKNHAAALQSFQHALARLPTSAELHNNCGNALKNLNRLVDAQACYERAIALKPEFAEAYNNYGTVLQIQKHYAAASENYDRAIALKPDYAYAVWNKALLKLLQGDFMEGWRLFEVRWQGILKNPAKNFTQPLWLGAENIAAKTLLIQAEQGLGDVIQFCRYVHMLAALGAKIIIETPPALTALLYSLHGPFTIIERGSPLPDFDMYCPLMSLPLAFKTTLDTIPAAVPYLYAEAEQQSRWLRRLGQKKLFRIGLVWSGGRAHTNDRNRSIPFAMLAPLFSLPFEFHSLQKEYREEDESMLAHFSQLSRYEADLTDFSATAALISQMDLVISVDTAVAHLAGAMAKPVWILLPYAADYRWLIDTESSPWYPTATLMRQSTQGDWTGVISAVKQKLETIIVSEYHQAGKLLEQFFLEAVSFHRAGSLANAERCYQKVLIIQPEHFDSLHYAGVIAAQSGNFEKANDLLGRATSIDNGNPHLFFNYGLALFQAKHLEDALENFARAIVLKPNYAEAYFNQGNVLQLLKRYDAALASYERAITCNVEYLEAYINRGNVLHYLNLNEAALASYERVIAINPDYPFSYNNIGNIKQILKQYDAALVNYQRAIALKPDYDEAYNNCGYVLMILKRYQEAMENFERAVTLNPEYAEAYINYANVLKQFGRHLEALKSYEKARKLKPDSEFLAGECLHIKMNLCDWYNLQTERRLLVEAVQSRQKVTPPFVALSITDDPAIHKMAAEIWTASKYPPKHEFAHLTAYAGHDKIRLAYFSADFYNHAVALLTTQLFETHDRSRFLVIAFSSHAENKDVVTLRLQQVFDEFIDISDLTDAEVVKLAREKEIDIAVDLSGHTGKNRVSIFAMRVAPVQVSYLGYLGTMGAEYIDYLLADPVIIPEAAQQHYVEKIAYLPSYQVNDARRRSVVHNFSRKALGLPETGFVFCCFNKNYKITPDTFSSWMRILRSVPGSVLMLFADNQQAETNLKNAAVSQHVDASRLVFGKMLPFSEYLARYRLADLFLDTRPYNAGATASDALWMGTPVLTCMGESFASRLAASLLTALNLPELITTSQAEYENRAIEIANNPEIMVQLKHKLTQNRSNSLLFDIAKFTISVENAFQQMYQRSSAGLSPEHIFVQN